MVTGVELETGLVVTVKFALVLPASTITVLGTVATDVLLLKRETTVPPVGAWPLNTTVPWEGFPPTTIAGCKVSEATVGGPDSTTAVGSIAVYLRTRTLLN